MSEMLKSKQGTLRAQTDVPVAVLIAGTAMVAIKCISILLLLGELGLSGLSEFVSTSAQAWDSTLIFLAGIVMLCLQIYCGFAVMRGKMAGAGAMWSVRRWWWAICCWRPSAASFPRYLPWTAKPTPRLCIP